MEIGIKGSDYIKIYFWRLISLITGFLSMLIVVPKLSSNVELFGLYSFCSSFILYLTYADIGFLNASTKFAAEEYAKGNATEEYKIFGFTFCILMIMFMPFSIFMIFLYLNPELILANANENILSIASKFFLIIGILLPVQVFFQRLIGLILIIRLKDYIFYRVEIFTNLIKIASVFYFFKTSYLIVEYFLFITLMSILSPIIAIIIAKRYFDFNFKKLLSSVSISKKYFNKTKELAFTSLFLTIGFIIFYEIDLLIIGKFIGIKEVGIYAIGFTILNFLRNITNIFYSPFSQRFNHLIGQNKKEELLKMINKIFDYTVPLFIFGHFILFLSIEKIILLWVGAEYIDSIFITQLLIICSSLGFVIQPANHYFVATLNYKYLYILAIVLPVSFLISITIFISSFGFEALAISKLITTLCFFVISLFGIFGAIEIYKIINKWFLPTLAICLASFFLMSFFIEMFNSLNKEVYYLIALVVIIGLVILAGYFVLLIFQKDNRRDIFKIYKKIKRDML